MSPASTKNIQTDGRTVMKMKLLKAVILCFLMSAFTVSALADTRIDTVSVTVTDAGTLEAGESIGDVTVTSSGEGYYVENAYFLNDHDIWQKNERPRIRIELYADEGYRFSYTSESHFSLSGFGATYSDANIMDDGSYMELDIYLDRVTGEGTSSSEDYNLAWDDYTATWNMVYSTDYYEIRLYRWNSSGTSTSIVTTKRSDDGEYDFTSYLTRSGNYSFRVRPVDADFDTGQLWSDHSPRLYIDSDEASDNRGYTDDSGSGNSAYYSGPGYYDTTDSQYGPGSTALGQWIQDDTGWWYRYNNGGWPFSSWQVIDDKWYYFNDQGYLLTGWFQLNGAWYYCGKDGAMTTGWQKIGPYWYYFSNSGVMATGWNLLDGGWYYLDPSSGALWTGTFTPDGHYVNANGLRLY